MSKHAEWVIEDVRVMAPGWEFVHDDGEVYWTEPAPLMGRVSGTWMLLAVEEFDGTVTLPTQSIGVKPPGVNLRDWCKSQGREWPHPGEK